MTIQFLITLFVFLSAYALLKVLKSQIKKFVNLILIFFLALSIKLIYQFSNGFNFPSFIVEIYIVFSASLIIVLIFKSIRFRLNQNKNYKIKLKKLIKLDTWIFSSVIILYLIIQLIIIWFQNGFLIDIY